MNIEQVRNLFSYAFDCKEVGDLEAANRTFWDTVRDGVPEEVVVVLKADDSEKPVDLVGWRQTRPHHFAILVLELEGEESQIIPVPVLEELAGEEFVDDLIKVAEYEEFVDDDWDGE